MNDRIVLRAVFAVTAAVLLAVVALHFVERPGEIPAFARALPGLNAAINFTCSVLLVGAWVAVRRGRVDLHRRLNLATFGLSVVFLLSYVVYHAVAPETRYPAGHALRPVYLAILFSHIALAAIVLPLVLLSFHRALTGRIAEHRKLVRWTFPIWLYVTVTGVVVWCMIRPYYPF